MEKVKLSGQLNRAMFIDTKRITTSYNKPVTITDSRVKPIDETNVPK
jgi:hypothetical protein